MTTERKLNVALVGLGRMGRNHFRVLRQSDRFNLVAVVDRAGAPPNALELGTARFAREVNELGDLKIDCAVVATPTISHFDVAAQLIERKVHVLVEKPLATRFDKCVELVGLARERGVHLVVGHVERFNPAVRKLREVLRGGWIGTPIHFNVTRVGGWPDTLISENNVVLDLAVHDIDVLRSLLGPLRIEASLCHATVQPGVCDTAEILMTSKMGASVTIHVNWITPTKIRQLRVTGSRAVCFVDYMLQTIALVGGNLLESKVQQNTSFEQLVEMYKSGDRMEFGVQKQEPLQAELEQFFSLITSGVAGDLCLGADASRAVLLAHRALTGGLLETKMPALAPTANMDLANASDEWL
jgi:UDP-N-acetylglucosamine 3-dehydrogenase